MSEKNDVETGVETAVEQSGTSQRQNGETETETKDASNTMQINQAFRLRVTEGLSLREIAEKTNLSLAAVGRLLKGIGTEKVSSDSDDSQGDDQETENNIPIDGADGENSRIHDHTLSPSAFSRRPGGIELLEEDRASIRKLVSKSALGPLEVIWGNAATRQRQRVDNNGHDGHSIPFYGGDAEQEVDWELAKLIKAKRIKLLTEDTSPQKNTESLGLKEIIEVFKLINPQKGNEPLGLKDLVEVAKVMGGSGTKETLQLVEYITQARNAGQNVTLNDISLKLEELKQLGGIADRRLDFEFLQYKDHREDEQQKYHLIETGMKTFEPMIGKLVSGIGAAARQGIKDAPGSPAAIQPVEIACPNPKCLKHFFADGTALTVLCPWCGVTLLHSAPSPQPPQEEEPTEQELATEPIKEPTEKQSPIKHDLGFEFGRGDKKA